MTIVSESLFSDNFATAKAIGWMFAEATQKSNFQNFSRSRNFKTKIGKCSYFGFAGFVLFDGNQPTFEFVFFE